VRFGRRLALALLGGLLAGLTGRVPAQDAQVRSAPYPAAVVEAFAHLPVQDGGRIKPLDTLARILLLRIRGRRSLDVPDEPRFGALAGERLTPIEWFLDLATLPAQADRYPVFRIEDRDVLDLVGLEALAAGKRDLYAFEQLAPHVDEIAARARAHVHTEEKHRTRLQNQLVDLYEDLLAYRGLRGAFAPARLELTIPPEGRTLRRAFGEAARTVRLSDLLENGARLLAAYRALSTTAPGSEAERAVQAADLAALDRFLSAPLEATRAAAGLRWIPPGDPAEEAWQDFSELFAAALQDDLGRAGPQIEAVGRLEAALDAGLAAADPAASEAAARALVDRVQALAAARGEGRQIEAEVAFHRRDAFGRAQLLFVAGLLLALSSFLLPRSALVYGLSWLVNAGAVLLMAFGLVERCLLRGRPPVTTLYETILFVTATGTLLALCFEAVVVAVRAASARRIAIAVAAALGALGSFVAARHEVFVGEDTMPQLQAVLDTNFWLSTHVTTVTLGYMAALLAGFLGHVQLLGRLFGWRRGRPQLAAATYRWIGRMTYAAICFAVLMATIGTILGGVWANDSWGRFWGWDPKENGALMIVLWNLLILHGRLAGLWRDGGIAVLAVCGNVIVAFSWWGVNLMGVGLHSYGFQSGLKLWVSLFYASQVLVAAIGWIGLRRERPRT
jgi:ABC-type transport system involved in cytochrome c biogenesis permease subunit